MSDLRELVDKLSEVIFELRKRNIDDIALGLVEPIKRELDALAAASPGTQGVSVAQVAALVTKHIKVEMPGVGGTYSKWEKLTDELNAALHPSRQGAPVK